MSAPERPEAGRGGGPTSGADEDRDERVSRRAGPQSVGPWGWGGGEDRPAPWGVDEDSPMDEGSEQVAVPEGRRGERRAAPGDRGRGPSEPAGRHGFGSVEPTRAPEAGPGGPPDPAPSRRTFPVGTDIGDVADNSLERQTGTHTRRASRRPGNR